MSNLPIRLAKLSIVIILVLPFVFGQISLLSSCFVTENKCPNKNITFWLYTVATQNNPLKLDELNLKNEDFLPKKKLAILIHGFSSNKDGDLNTEIRPLLLNKNLFVISVDYEPLVKSPCYIQSIDNTKIVGKCLGGLITGLVAQGIFTPSDIHLIGHSLGAQVAGISSNHVTEKVGRISGLDPAKPIFNIYPTSERLDASDADFVDVVHTDVLGIGISYSLGNVDFYPNGGTIQAGCEDPNILDTQSCNHNRAITYFAESITTEIGFYGFKCSSWLLFILGLCRWNSNSQIEIMGYYTPATARGNYFLYTNSNPPYAKGMNGLTT